MTSKWIKELTIAIFKGKSNSGESPDEIISKVDKLLKGAAFSTDDEDLHEAIMKEIREDERPNPT